MNRKHFIKQSLLGAAGLASTNAIAKPHQKRSTYDKMMDQVGFNHLPNAEIRTMKTVVHLAHTRGQADHGWLKSHHSFSFANYYNPDRMHFGVLRVLNDDVVAGGKGFARHPHDNMEIVSIPLSGDLEHKDSMGNVAVIREGDVQVMSAGTGIYHSEYNKNPDETVKFLQIWMFPNTQNVSPRYDQISMANSEPTGGSLQQILSPSPDDDGVWAHQDAWFHIGTFESDQELSYTIRRKGNGVYAFVLEGELNIEGQALGPRDGFGVWDTDQIKIEARGNSRLLLMDVPMQVS